jgi:peptide-methionine (S)-S-oxide reductase
MMCTNTCRKLEKLGFSRWTLAELWILILGALLTIGICMNAAPEKSTRTEKNVQTATFGGGCFWCGEAVFQRIPGVKSVVSGYAGGEKDNPTYKEVCNGDTGHAEVIQIKFDPAVLSYEKILEVFFEEHDPTTLNRQGHDVGTQYRSIILYSNDEQKKVAEKAKADAQKNYKDPIVTEIVPLKKFYAAEDYHQNYFNTHGSQGYCAFIIRPKLQKLISKKVISEKPVTP